MGFSVQERFSGQVWLSDETSPQSWSCWQLWQRYVLSFKLRAHSLDHTSTKKTQGTTSDYFADVGYFTDGTSIIAAGNANNHHITAEDPHTNGSPLVASTYMADVGYFADGTSMIKAGNANNHPITATDPHTNGSPLPSSKYAAEVGYFVDGTDVTKAGNMNNR